MKSIQKTCMLLAALTAPGYMQAGELPNTVPMSGLQFNFSAPGARSLAMGGAFLGRADDSTAAFANPAGLTNLFSPEIAAEFRFNGYDTPYTSGGTYPNPIRSTTSSDANNLSYLSFVYPREKWVFALYRQQFMDFNSDFDSAAISTGEGVGFATTNTVDVNIVNYGFSTALRLSDRWSLGASFSYFDYEMDADTLRTLEGVGDVSRQTQRGNDNSWGVTMGALFRATDRFSVGLVYRLAPDFATEHTQVFKLDETDPTRNFTRDYSFETPDVYGVGLSFQPNDNLTFNFDIMEVRYSQLASPVFWAFESPSTPEGEEIVDEMSISNGTEFHLGAEYVMKNKPIALRAGVWHDPEHALVYKGPTDAADTEQRATALFFPKGSDQTHFSVGFGFFLSTFQMDFAADFSDNQDTYSVSGVYRFN